jgi:hypothetical protein
LMAALQQAPHHVSAHPAKADHSELHALALHSRAQKGGIVSFDVNARTHQLASLSLRYRRIRVLVELS